MSDEYDTSREEMDAEVLADLELRRRTLFERGDRYNAPPLTYKRTPDVTSWRCAVPRCDVRIPVTQDAVDRLAIFNAELERRGERQIPTDAVLLCADHQLTRNELRAQKQHERRQRVRDNVRKLKEAADIHTMPDVIAELRRDHHPDVDGLIAALEGRDTSKRGKRRARL